MIAKRRYIEAQDGNPYDDNPCRDDQGTLRSMGAG